MRNAVAVAVLLILGALIALWVIYFSPRPPRNNGGLESAEYKPNAAPRRDLPPPMPRDAKAAPEEKPADRPVTPDAQPAPAVKEDDCVAEGALWVPNYGGLLKRGGGRAEIEVVDAHGKPPEGDRYNDVRLWRKLGSFWIADEAWYDGARNTAVCDGLSNSYADAGAGLEPGEYELEVTFGAYGGMRHRFAVAAGESVREKAFLPNYLRIICLRFTDSAGTPLPYIYQSREGTPFAISEADVFEATARPLPGGVMRDPPGAPRRSVGGGRHSASSGTRLVMPAAYATDEGRFYLPVFAGATNTITIPLDPEIWGRPTITLVDRCTGPEWDAYPVPIDVPADFMDRLNARVEKTRDLPNRRDHFLLLGKDDPGRKSLLSPPPPPPPPPAPNPRDTGNLADKRVRVLLKASGVPGAYPLYWTGGGKDRQPDRFRAAARFEEGWLFELEAGREYEYCWSDGKLFQSAPEKLVLGGSKFVEVASALDARPVEITFAPPSPTIAAFIHAVQLDGLFTETEKGPRAVNFGELKSRGSSSSISDGQYLGQEMLQLGIPRDSTGFVLRSALAPNLREIVTSGKSTWYAHALGAGRRNSEGRHWGTGKDRRHQIRRFWEGSGTDLIQFPLTTTTEKDDGVRLADGRIEFRPAVAGLALRAVSNGFGGLPMVEASLLSYEEDKVSLALRRAGLKMEKGLPRVDSDVVVDPRFYEADEATSDAELREKLGGAVYDALETRTQREFFLRQGAWYNTRQKFISDGHGYIIAAGLKLEPGKRYVLYLWSASRDENVPDMRLDFLASETGLTDLGVVMLPDYR